MAHRIAYLLKTQEWPEDEVGHKNDIGNDNRWENLVPCTRAENEQNKVRLKNEANS